MRRALLIAIIASNYSASAEWDIPNELHFLDHFLKLYNSFSPVAHYTIKTSNNDNQIWLVPFAKLVAAPSYSESQLIEFSECSFVYSNRRSCFAKIPSEPCKNPASRFCLKSWRQEFKSNGNIESCFVDKHKVDCDKVIDRMAVKLITYNDTHIFYSLKPTINHKKMFYQDVIKTDVQFDFLRFFPTPSESEIIDEGIHSSHSDKIIVYGRNICVQNSCENEIMKFIQNGSDFCAFNNCVNIVPSHEFDYNDNIFELNLRISPGYKQSVNAETNIKSSNRTIPAFLKMLVIKTETLDTSYNIPRFYKRRGRFHCPSEVFCLSEIFYNSNHIFIVNMLLLTILVYIYHF